MKNFITIFLLVLATFSCAVADNKSKKPGGNLKVGDFVLLRTGATLSAKGVARSVEDVNQRLKTYGSKIIKYTLDDVASKSKALKAKASSIHRMSFAIERNPKNKSTQEICDELILSVVQLRLRPVSKKLKQLAIDIKPPNSSTASECLYNIKNQIALERADGRPFSGDHFDFHWLELEGFERVLAAPIVTRRTLGIAEIIVETFVIVPVDPKDTTALARYLEAISQATFKRLPHKGILYKFHVAQAGSAPGKFRLPLRSAMAVTDGDRTIFVRGILPKMTSIRDKDGKANTKKYVEVALLNSNLAHALSNLSRKIEPDKAIEYVGNGVYSDAKIALELIGSDFADFMGMDNVVVVSKEVIPGKRMGMRIPINFVKLGDRWVITNRKKNKQ